MRPVFHLSRPVSGLFLLAAGLMVSACAGTHAMNDSPSFAIELPPLAESERQPEHDKPAGEPLQAGVGRKIPHDRHRLPLAELDWVEDGDQRSATVSVRSPGASGLRVGLHLKEGPDCAMSLQFIGVDGTASEAVPAGRLLDAEHPWWSPTTRGDTARIRLSLPDGADVAACELHLPRVSHLY